MLVVLANSLPPAVRGRMKLWFIEPMANVFISSVKDSVAKEIVDYLYKYCPPESGLLIFHKINKCPGYQIKTIGEHKKKLCSLTGLQLVIEKEGDLEGLKKG